MRRIAIAIALVLSGGLPAASQTTDQTCKPIAQLEICGDWVGRLAVGDDGSLLHEEVFDGGTVRVRVTMIDKAPVLSRMPFRLTGRQFRTGPEFRDVEQVNEQLLLEWAEPLNLGPLTEDSRSQCFLSDEDRACHNDIHYVDDERTVRLSRVIIGNDEATILLETVLFAQGEVPEGIDFVGSNRLAKAGRTVFR